MIKQKILKVTALMAILGLTFLGLVPSAPAATVRVPADYPTILQAIDAANPGDVVEISCGTYYEALLWLKSGITIRSETQNPACVTIDAQNISRVFYCQSVDNTTVIEGITITGGLDIQGGGAYLENSSPIFNNCIFTGNMASSEGGGLYCSDGSEPNLNQCTFLNNTSDSGGGMYSFQSAPQLSYCSFTGNGATSSGGGLALVSPAGLSLPAVTYSVFDNNTAGSNGGGIYCRSSIPTINYCTLYGNGASGQGGGICYELTSPSLINTIVAYGTGGGAIFADEFSSPSFNSCDLYANVGGDWVGSIADQAGSNANFSADPGFCNRAGGDYQLCADSLCLPGTLPNGQSHQQIGAFAGGCSSCGPFVPARESTWGEVKALYR
jgi:predicted outer membrane repeat protein/parallel beta-helix repeat protein